LTVPIIYRIEAEFVDPDDPSVLATLDGSVCRALRGVDEPPAAKVERVNQPEGSARRHGLAERDSGGTLCNSDLDQA